MIVGARESSDVLMRAACHDQWGAPLTVVDMARPEPAAGEVRVAVHATSVNPVDRYTGFHAYQLAPMPVSASFTEAGSLPMGALTAWQMLDAGQVRAGQRVLVSGASGGVGHLAVQVAVARGATVVALARPEHHAILGELGAHECVDYTDAAAVAAIEPVDVALDVVGGAFGTALFDLVRPGGAAVLAMAWSIPGYAAEAAERGIRAVSYLVEPDPQALRALATLVDDKALRVVVGAEFELARAAAAQQWVADRGGFGKAAIVVRHE